tara:strand:- start:250 stop:654 length:405 start_codon:yes stop_codon:yes gene_type:complete
MENIMKLNLNLDVDWATLARYTLGLVFVVFGVNAFVGLVPTPEPSPEGGAFLGALAATGYILPLLKAVEIAAGVALLLNRHVRLALVALVPVIVNIVAYHAVLDPGGLLLALVVAGLEAYLIWVNREHLTWLLD